MTKKALNKILVKFQKAGVEVAIEKEEILSNNFKQWLIRFRNNNKVIYATIGYNIYNDEIGVRFTKSQQPTNIYRIGVLLGLKYIMEI